MIEQQGRVERVDTTYAWVRVGSRSGCAACDAGRGCGAGIFARLLQRDSVLLRVPNDVGAKTGNAVLLGIPETAFLNLVMRLYGLPLLAGIVGAAIGHQAANAVEATPALRDAAALFSGLMAAILAVRLGTAKGPRGLSFDIDLIEVKRECD